MKQAHQVLKETWGYDSFRPLQDDIVQAAVNGKDVLALLPTGGGKSICFQVPALMMEGLCLVVSPLIALMKDQVHQLVKRGVTAEAIHAGMSKREVDITLDNCVNASIKFLYVSPERLKTELFIERLKIIRERRGVCLLAIDEAHCISQWGYDFRPSYLEIAEIRPLIPETNVLALTATATPKVRADIQDKLQFRETEVFTKSFARANLSYAVRFEEHKERKLLEILAKVQGTAVVYVNTRKRTQEIATLLKRHHIHADYYHAGLSFEERSLRQDQWIHDRIRVIVSTNAFGMGIDKADVRLVVHMDLPGNLEAYYQEAGRGGRDEKKAFAVIISNQKDIDELRNRTRASLPEIVLVKQVYQMLGNYYQLALGSHPQESLDFDFEKFSKNFDKKPLEIFHAIKALESQKIIQLSDTFYQPSRLMFSADQKQLYEFQIANVMFDPVIKSLLRLYGGELYSNYLVIQEQKVATHLGISKSDCLKLLQQLDQYGVVSYLPQKDQPQLTFLTPKVKPEKLAIDSKTLKAKRTLTLEKMEAVIAYTHNARQCRTQQLLAYFGEVSYDACGVCDNCIDRKKHQADDTLRQQYQKQTLALLHEDIGFDLEKLTKVLAPTDKELFTNLVSELLDHGILYYDEFGKIRASK